MGNDGVTILGISGDLGYMGKGTEIVGESVSTPVRLQMILKLGYHGGLPLRSSDKSLWTRKVGLSLRQAVRPSHNNTDLLS